MVELLFPAGGIDRSMSADRRSPLTTDEAANFLAIDAGTGVMRGAKRPGLKKAGSAAVGVGHVQSLKPLSYSNPALVTYTPAADGSAFTGSETWQASSPNGAAITCDTFDAEGNRYYIDTTGSLGKLSRDGKPVWQTTIPKKHGAHIFRGLTISAVGDVYVAVGRKNEVGAQAIEGLFNLSGLDTARIYRFTQEEPVEGVEIPKLAWEYVTGQYVTDMQIVGAYLVALQEDILHNRAYAVSYQLLEAGAPTIRWRTTIPYPCNTFCASKDGTLYIACEPTTSTAAASTYGQSVRNAQGVSSGMVGPVHGWSLAELKKKGWRVWGHYRADKITGAKESDAALLDGQEIVEWVDLSGYGRHLTVPSGTFSFTGVSNIGAAGPRYIKFGPNALPEVRFLGIIGAAGVPGSQRFTGLVSDPPDSTDELAELANGSTLPSYTNCAFMVMVVMRPNFGTTNRTGLMGQDYSGESGLSSDLPMCLLVNQEITSGAYTTTAVGGDIALLDPVRDTGAGANGTSPPSGVTGSADYSTPVSIDGRTTENGGKSLPHGYCIASWIFDGKFTGSFQNEATYKGTMSQFNVNGTVLDRYGSHQHTAKTSTYAPTTVGWVHNDVIDLVSFSDFVDPYQGGVLEILILNRYDKSQTTGLHTTDDAATTDPIILSHYLLPDDPDQADVPGQPDNLLTYNVTDQIAGASTVTTDEWNLLLGAASWDWGFECMPRTSDAVAPHNFTKNMFAIDPCANRLASGCPPFDTTIAFGGPRDPNWINYPHGMVIKLNGDDGSQIWVAADYSSANNNRGIGVGIALVQDYNDDEANPSVRKLVSYGPAGTTFRDAFYRVLTDNGETVSLGAVTAIYTTPLAAIILRDRYPKCGTDGLGNAYIPGNFKSNFGPSSGATATDSAFTLAVVKKDGTLRLHYDVDGNTIHRPCFSAQPDPISPIYPDTVNKLGQYVVLGIDSLSFNAAGAAGAATTACLRKIKLVDQGVPTGVPRVTEYLAYVAGDVKKFTEVAGVLSGPTALSPAGPYLSTTSKFGRIIVGLEGAVFLDGSSYKHYDPKLSTANVTDLKAKKGRIPERCTLGAFWLHCLCLGRPSDSPSEWFMSAVGDLRDWDFDRKVFSPKQAVRLQNKVGGHADPITALHPVSDTRIIVGGERSVSAFSGHPNVGSDRFQISSQVGVLYGDACTSDNEGNFYFVSTSLDVHVVGRDMSLSPPISNGIKEALQAIDTQANRIVLGWDPRHELLIVSQVPYTTLGLARAGWVWQRSRNAWFDVDFEVVSVQPTAVMAAQGASSALRRTLIGCEDGWVRFLDPSITYDEDGDGTKRRIYARAKLGPVTLNGAAEVAVTSARVVLGDTDAANELAQGGADFELYVAKSPDVFGAPAAQVKLGPGRSDNIHLSARGMIAVARISNADVNERLAVERVMLEAEQAGEG